MNPNRKLKSVVTWMGIKFVAVFAILATVLSVLLSRDSGIIQQQLVVFKYVLGIMPFISAALFYALYRYLIGYFRIKDEERQVAEKKLALHSTRLHTLTGFSERVATFGLDANLCLTEFNDFFVEGIFRLWGQEVVLGKSILEVIPEGFHEAANRNFNRALAGEHFKITTYFGKEYFTHVLSPVIESTGKIAGLTASIFEVTDRIKAEQELESYKDQLEDLVQERTKQLQKQSAFFQEVLDGLPNLIFVRDQNHKYVLANKAMLDSFGLPGESIIGKSILETHHDMKEARKYELEDKNIIRENEVFEEEAMHHLSSDQTKWLFLSKRRLVIDHDVYVLGVHFDITNLKETQFKLLKANQELKDTLTRLKSTQMRLVESEKMASLGQLTAGLAHEINNPINYVSGNVRPIRRDLLELKEYIELLRQGKPVPDFNYHVLFDELDSLLDGVDEGTARVKNLMNDLNTFSLPDTSRKHLHDINESIKTTLNLVKHHVKDRIDMKVELKDMPKTWCNPQQLSQVFLNILNNAIQSIEGMGQISVTSAMKSGQLIIKIKDTGKGIPQDNLTRIFDPFFTTKDVGQGTGLGLAISYRIVEEHGGKIEVKSREQKGTTFKVILPIHQSVN